MMVKCKTLTTKEELSIIAREVFMKLKMKNATSLWLLR